MSGLQVERDLQVPMRDGVVLRGDMWRPDGDTPRPTILFRTPYNKDNNLGDFLRPADCIAGGYCAFVQDTRGRFASEGEWSAIGWQQEGEDGHDTIEWLAQQAWCDGNVGMAGASYLGITQLAAAVTQPLHLRAIAPSMATTAALDRLDTGGAIRWDHLVTWIAFMAAEWVQRQLAAGKPVDGELVAQVLEVARDPSAAMAYLPLTETPPFAHEDFPLPIAEVLSGEVERSADIDLAAVSVPVLNVGGWYDIYAGSTVGAFKELVEHGRSDDHRLIVGPWVHSSGLTHYQGELNFGLPAAGAYAGLAAKHLSFFDRHLKDSSTESPKVEYFVMGANEWRTANTWPPSEATEQSWHLGASGILQPEPCSGPPDEFDYDPAEPTPTHGGRVLYLGRLVGGPLDQSRRIEPRPDVLVYTSSMLDEPLEVAGEVKVQLHASSSAVDTDWVVRLTDAFPDGRSLLIAEGILRARFRHGFDEETFLIPEVVEKYVISAGSTAWRFEPGHRIRLQVTCSSFPHYDRNLNTGEPIGQGRTPVVAHQRIYHDSTKPSRVVLPVLAPE